MYVSMSRESEYCHCVLPYIECLDYCVLGVYVQCIIYSNVLAKQVALSPFCG